MEIMLIGSNSFLGTSMILFSNELTLRPRALQFGIFYNFHRLGFVAFGL